MFSTMELKYPRRSKRSIGGKTFNIEPPDTTRSNTMRRIPNKRTSIEILLASALRESGIKYRRTKHIFGNPDFRVYKTKILIFCDGDFWHGFNLENMVFKTNADFWSAKIKRNVERGIEVNKTLESRGWKVIRLWEHDIRKNIEKCIDNIRIAMMNEGSISYGKK